MYKETALDRPAWEDTNIRFCSMRRGIMDELVYRRGMVPNEICAFKESIRPHISALQEVITLTSQCLAEIPAQTTQEFLAAIETMEVCAQLSGDALDIAHKSYPTMSIEEMDRLRTLAGPLVPNLVDEEKRAARIQLEQEIHLEEEITRQLRSENQALFEELMSQFPQPLIDSYQHLCRILGRWRLATTLIELLAEDNPTDLASHLQHWCE